MHTSSEPSQTGTSQKLAFSVIPTHSYHHFYRIELQGTTYMVKVFSPDRIPFHNSQQNLLQSLTHASLPKPITLDPSLLSSLHQEFKGQLLVYPFAKNGNLLSFVQKLHGLPQLVIGYYLREIIAGLKYVWEKRGIAHGNLNLENVLVEEDYACKVIGWCNSKEIKREVCFSLGEMALTMLIGRSPFTRKEMKYDQLGKFLTQGKVAIFWQLIEKSIKRTHKTFTISQGFRNVVGGVLMKKIEGLEKIDERYGLEVGAGKVQNVKEQLKKKQELIGKIRKERIEKQNAIKKKQKDIAEQENQAENMGVEKDSTRSGDKFYEEFTALKDESYQIPKNMAHQSKEEHFRLFDDDPRVILAHLRTYLHETQKNQSQSYFMHPFLRLKQHQYYASLQGNELKIHLPVAWWQELGGEEAGMQVVVELVREKQGLMGVISEVQNGELSDECEMWVVGWVKKVIGRGQL